MAAWALSPAHTPDPRTLGFLRRSFRNITAGSDAAFRRLIGQFISFYKDSLFNPDWGEIVAFRPDNTLAISMVFQGFDKQQAEKVWRPFFDWVRGSPIGLTIETDILTPAELMSLVRSSPEPSRPAETVWNVVGEQSRGGGILLARI